MSQPVNQFSTLQLSLVTFYLDSLQRYKPKLAARPLLALLWMEKLRNGLATKLKLQPLTEMAAIVRLKYGVRFGKQDNKVLQYFFYHKWLNGG